MYSLNSSQTLHKLDERSQKCIFIGYCTKFKAYRLYNHVSHKIIISRDVKFVEDAWCPGESNGRQSQWESSVEDVVMPLEEAMPQLVLEDIQDAQDSLNSSSTQGMFLVEYAQSPDSSVRRNAWLIYIYIYESCSFALNIVDPLTYSEVAQNKVWMNAMDAKIISIQKNDTWSLTELQAGKKSH